ncbi:DUF1232 domain-containing protein [Cytophagaceae bacterium ABcell3]|nr:DUF1232 domain-containing protein [Cytophagaceae bacterium ABcell3]
MDQKKFAKKYSESAFWSKVKLFAKKAGARVIYAALLLYYVLQKEDVPKWAKGVVLGALGYFISPLDLIPDFAAPIGYTDDLATLLAALGALGMFVDIRTMEKAKGVMTQWFGENIEKELEGFKIPFKPSFSNSVNKTGNSQ